MPPQQGGRAGMGRTARSWEAGSGEQPRGGAGGRGRRGRARGSPHLSGAGDASAADRKSKVESRDRLGSSGRGPYPYCLVAFWSYSTWTGICLSVFLHLSISFFSAPSVLSRSHSSLPPPDGCFVCSPWFFFVISPHVAHSGATFPSGPCALAHSLTLSISQLDFFVGSSAPTQSAIALPPRCAGQGLGDCLAERLRAHLGLGVNLVQLIPCPWAAHFPLGASEESNKSQVSRVLRTFWDIRHRSPLGKHLKNITCGCL